MRVWGENLEPGRCRRSCNIVIAHSEVGNVEAARCEHVSASSRGDRAGIAARSARTCRRSDVRVLDVLCLRLMPLFEAFDGRYPGLIYG